MNSPVGEQAVLRLIQSKAATSQIELARALNLRPNTIHGMVKRLEAEGFISEEREERGARGRPALHFGINLPGKVLVIQALGTEWRSKVVDGNRTTSSTLVVLHSPVVPDAAAARECFVKVRDLALEAAGVFLSDLDGIIVAMNSVKLTSSSIVTSSVIPWIGELSEETLTGLLGAPVVMGASLHYAELELRNWTREGIRSLIRFNVGDGVSAHYAALVGSWAQVSTLPGEVGHIVRDTSGEICGCGNRGCLETVMAGPRFVRRLTGDLEAGVHTVLKDVAGKAPGEFFRALYEADINGTDAYARTVSTEFLGNCAWALSVAINMFRPEIVVLDGYGLAGFACWWDRIRELLPSLLIGAPQIDLRLESARLQPSDMMHELATEFFMRQRGIL